MISIITPTYNRAHLLPRMVKGILNQTYKSWELIIVDDGSTDDTAEIVQPFLRDPRIKFMSKNNSGGASSRNVGVNLSKGEYIIFLDSDDEPKFNWLELLSNGIDFKDSTIVSCGWEKVDDKNNLIEVCSPQNLGPFFNNITLNYLAGSLLLKRSLFMEIGGFDISLQSGHHTDLLLRLLPVLVKYKVKIVNIPETLLRIYCHSGIKIRANHNFVYNGTMSLLKKHEIHFRKNKKEHIDYLSVAAISALKLGKVHEGKSLLRHAFFLKPINFKSVFRIIIVELPFLRNHIWK